MKKYNKYGHHKKKAWKGATLTNLIKVASSFSKRVGTIFLYCKPGVYSENIKLRDNVNLWGFMNEEK